MATPNRSSLISKLFKVLKKHYEPLVPPQRSLLEHLLYGCLLENSTFVAADEVFARLQESYFDWNEMRVTTPVELSESMQGLADVQHAAINFRRALQGVFETHYAFDLESLKKQNLGKAVQQLEKLCEASPFAVAYANQHGLGGHAIPLGWGTIEIFHLVGGINDAEFARKEVPGLERAIPKNKGVEFASLLHQFAADFVAAPNSQRVKSILLEIDSDAKERLKKRAVRLEAEAAQRTADRQAAHAARVAAEKARVENERLAAKAAADKALADKAAAEKKAADKAAAEIRAAERAQQKANAERAARLRAAAPPPPPAPPVHKPKESKEKPHAKDRKPAAPQPPSKAPARKLEPAQRGKSSAKNLTRKKPR